MRYEDMHFVSPEEGWIVHSQGKLVYTKDGLQTYAIDSSIAVYDSRPRSMSFSPSAQVGWIGSLRTPGTRSPILLKSSDRGRTFRPVHLPDKPKAGICGVQAIDDSTAFAAGSYHLDRELEPAVIRTLDGDEWEVVLDNESAIFSERGLRLVNLIDVHFFDAREGLVTGGVAPIESTDDSKEIRAAMLYTPDAGNSWTLASDPVQTDLPRACYGWKIQRARNILYVSLASSQPGKRLFVLKTDLRGQQLEVLSSRGELPNQTSLQGVGFLNAHQGWVGNRYGPALATHDAGRTWTPMDSPPMLNTNRFLFFGKQGYACGTCVHVFSNGCWQAVRGL